MGFNESDAKRDALDCGGAQHAQQPDPVPNELPPVWNQVIADMHARNQLGLRRYGTQLQPFNGRDALRDAYEEALDLAVYLRQAIMERDGK